MLAVLQLVKLDRAYDKPSRLPACAMMSSWASVPPSRRINEGASRPCDRSSVSRPVPNNS